MATFQKQKSKVDKKKMSLYSVDLRPDHPPTGYCETLMHLLKGNIGVGLFAMGEAFKNGGLIVSPIMTVVIAIICIHCQYLLLNCSERVGIEYIKDDDDPIDYAIAVELCFENGPEKISSWSEKMGSCVNIFICITQIGFCCIYLVFIASNLQQILGVHNINIDLRLMIFIVWIPIWLFCLITNLKALAPVSLIANILIFISFTATVVLAFKDGIDDLSERKPYTTPQKFALFFGTIIFAYEGIALLLPLRNVMRKPKTLTTPCGVLNVGMSIVISMYMIAGFSGYIKWGEEVEGSMTLNLGNTIIAQCVKSAVSLGILLTYPLQFYVPIEILLPGFLKKCHLTDREKFGEFLFRTIMTLFTLIIAEIVPKVGIFISFIGALCSTALALIFPPIIECLLLHQTDHSVWVKRLIIIKNIIILIISVLGLLVGSTISLIEIVEFIKTAFS